jgi:hypothetical protein
MSTISLREFDSRYGNEYRVKRHTRFAAYQAMASVMRLMDDENYGETNPLSTAWNLWHGRWQKADEEIAIIRALYDMEHSI